MEKADQIRFYSALGEKIMKARIDANIKQEPFGKLLGLTRTSIINIEKGRQHPSIHLLWEIARILEIEVVSLLPDFKTENTISPEIKEKIDGIENTESRLKITNFIIQTEKWHASEKKYRKNSS